MAEPGNDQLAERTLRMERMLAVMTKAGYERIAPPILQPAGHFLDVLGESLRGRTYVFTDPDGEEFCLRPDLTVPTCRIHLERHDNRGETQARYCYAGPVFRYQRGGGNAAHLREFSQCGIESFAFVDREEAEVEVLSRILAALKAAGLKTWRIRIGDIGIFDALLAAVDMPDRWRVQLRQTFWRPEAFRAELKRLAGLPATAVGGLPGDLVRSLDPADPEGAITKVENYLAANGIEPIGARSVAEVTERLLMAAVDSRSEPLPGSIVDLIERYLSITAPMRAAGARLKDMARERGIDISAALDAYNRRIELMNAAGIETSKIDFSAEFGRSFEYYTGFVFEIIVPELGPKSPVAGGGRYDTLMLAVGAQGHVNAVGAAIYAERLALVIEQTPHE